MDHLFENLSREPDGSLVHEIQVNRGGKPESKRLNTCYLPKEKVLEDFFLDLCAHLPLVFPKILR